MIAAPTNVQASAVLPKITLSNIDAQTMLRNAIGCTAEMSSSRNAQVIRK